MRRNSKMEFVLQPEEEVICQESQLSAKILQHVALSRAELQQAPQIQMQRLHEARKQHAKLNPLQIHDEEQREVESNHRRELREFLEQRAEQRRLYQARKIEAQLAEFWEQRAQAWPEYRAAKVWSWIGSTMGELHHDRRQARHHARVLA
jgi:hypothetical protein